MPAGSIWVSPAIPLAFAVESIRRWRLELGRGRATTVLRSAGAERADKFERVAARQCPDGVQAATEKLSVTEALIDYPKITSGAPELLVAIDTIAE
jgi:hypothetical protein